MQDAATIAQKYHHTLVWPVHLALALLGPLPCNSPFDSLPQSHFLKLIALAHGDLQIFQNALIQTIVGLPSNKLPPKHVIRSGDLERVLSQANSCRTTQNETLVAIEHLISGILRDGDVQAALQVAYTPRSKINSIHIAIDESENRVSKLSKSNVAVVAFVTDTSLAAKRMVDPVIGRDEEIRRLITVLSRRKNNNAILVGESGIGKTSIVSFNFLCAFGFETHSQNLGGKSHDSVSVFEQLYTNLLKDKRPSTAHRER
jgi:ATP-dependent Clp protease ATP-binding subunit ClpB